MYCSKPVARGCASPGPTHPSVTWIAPGWSSRAPALSSNGWGRSSSCGAPRPSRRRSGLRPRRTRHRSARRRRSSSRTSSTRHVSRGFLGDEAWNGLLRWHDDALRRVAVELEGTEVKRTGDGFFLTFSDPGLAIEAAIRIQRAPGRSPSGARLRAVGADRHASIRGDPQRGGLHRDRGERGRSRGRRRRKW